MRFDIPYNTLLSVEGEDRKTFLQGQLTQDILAVKDGEAKRSFVLNPQGKILADLWVLMGVDQVMLLANHDPGLNLKERFESYLFSEEVEPKVLQGVAIGLLDGVGADEVGHSSERRFVNKERGVAFVLFNEPQTHQVKESVMRYKWERFWPCWGVEFDGQHYPAETGVLEEAVSFNKGCYLGQEVVYMQKQRGKPRTGLFAVSIETLEPLEGPLTSEHGDEVGALLQGTVHAVGPETRAFARIKTSHAGKTFAKHHPVQVIAPK